MARRHRKPKTPDPANLVLLGPNFDTGIAMLFVTQVRSVGRLVKTVGLGATKLKGMYGITIHADLTMSQAIPMAPEVQYALLPFDTWGLRQAGGDPRLVPFLRDMHDAGATFIQSEDLAQSTALSRILVHGGTVRTITYPKGAEFFELLDDLQLSQRDIKSVR